MQTLNCNLQFVKRIRKAAPLAHKPSRMSVLECGSLLSLLKLELQKRAQPPVACFAGPDSL